jgi:hypothetical protein
MALPPQKSGGKLGDSASVIRAAKYFHHLETIPGASMWNVAHYLRFGFCPWQIHNRPLKGVPLAGPLGLDHYYFYNTQTGQSIGLGPATNTLAGPVPGNWERNEKPGHNVVICPLAPRTRSYDA